MRFIFAIRHPETGAVIYVGESAHDPVVSPPLLIPPDIKVALRAWSDPPVYETLEVLPHATGPTTRAYRYQRHFGLRKADQARPEIAPPPPPPPPEPVPKPRPAPKPPPVPVTESVVTTAIRLRTELLTYEDIAGRLTQLGQPAGHSWTAGEVRDVIAWAFNA